MSSSLIQSALTSLAPIVLVGMPRSGSTLTTRLLNESPDLFVVNDFYLLQALDAAGELDGVLSTAQAERVAREIVQRIRARVERSSSPPIECGLMLRPEQESALLTDALGLAKSMTQPTWSRLLDGIMTLGAQAAGKSRWGYNTPQDHIHLDRLFEAFPQMKAVFLLRDPRDTVRSYKYVTGNGYHDPKRYHPAMQTLAWRTAVRRYQQLQADGKAVMLVRYEDVVAKPNETMGVIAAFTGIAMPPLDLSQFGHNSSFRRQQTSTQTNTQLKESEIALCEQLAAKEMTLLGYDLSNSRLRLSELGYLTYITARFAGFYAIKGLASKDVRRRIVGMFRAAVAGRRAQIES